MSRHDAGWNFYSNKVTKCDRCNQPIIFRQSNNGKWIAYDPTWLSPDGKEAKSHGGHFHKCRLIKAEYHQKIYINDLDDMNNYKTTTIDRIKESPCNIEPDQEIIIKGIKYICTDTETEDTYQHREEDGYRISIYNQVISLSTMQAYKKEKEEMEKAREQLKNMFKRN